MTVAELMKFLRKADPKARIVFATGPSHRVDVLSIYSSDLRSCGPEEEINKQSKILFVDIG